MNLHPVTLPHRGTTLRGWRLDPEPGTAAPTSPVVVLVHGFSDTSHGPRQAFVQVAGLLAARGCTVFSFDRLGHGISDGDFADIRITDEVDQIARMVGFAASQAPSGSVHVVAHSLGAVESAIVAARTGSCVESLTLWSPAGVVVDDIAGKNEIQGQSLASVAEIGYFDFGGLALGPSFIAEVRGGLDVYALARGYTGPVQVLHGTADTIVPVAYGRRYAEIYGDAATFTSVEGADHAWSSVAIRRDLFARTLAQIAPSAV